MTQQNNTGPQKQVPEKTRPVNPRQQQRRKTVVAALIMFVPFCICIYLIYGGGAKERPEYVDGINVNIPEGRSEQIEGDKAKAAQRVRDENRREGLLATLGDEVFGGSDGVALPDSTSVQSEATSQPPAATAQKGGGSGRINQSQQAYTDITRQLNTFYNEPTQQDTEVERLKKQLEELKSQVSTQNPAKTDQFALMERSYELASKYFGGNGGQNIVHELPTKDKRHTLAVIKSPDLTVTALQQNIPQQELMQMLRQERNFGFNTAVGKTIGAAQNSIRACIDQDQTIISGSRIRLRLLDAIIAGNTLIPVNSVVTGEAKLSGQRLEIDVTTLEYKGTIIPVDLAAHDTDGQQGLFVPDSRERTALKEATAGVASNMGSGISISRDAKSQIVADAARGIIGGVTQYTAAKLREVKITLKANYQLLLIPKQ